MESLWREIGKMMSLWEKNKTALGSIWEKDKVVIGSILEKNKAALGSCWDKNKVPISSFWAEKKRNIIMLFCEILSISVASYFFLPFIITDAVEQNFYFTPWYILGLGVTCFGIFGMIYSLFSFGKKEKFEHKFKILWKITGIYIGGRLVFAFVAGILGTVFIQYENNIEQVKFFIDRVVRVGLGPLNAFILLYFVKMLYDTSWKFIWENILLITIMCYSTEFLFSILQLAGSSIFALGIRSFISACMITGVFLFVLFLPRQEEVKHEYKFLR